MRKPTIYEVLHEKLGRDPTNEEIKADIERIFEESRVELANHGKLPHQRKRRPIKRRPQLTHPFLGTGAACEYNWPDGDEPSARCGLPRKAHL